MRNNTYQLSVKVPRLNLESTKPVELKTGYFLPVMQFYLENKSKDLRIDETKLNKVLIVFSHYRRESINYDIKYIQTKPSVGEINLNCHMDKALECALQEGTVKFKLENSEEGDRNLIFSDPNMMSYTGKFNDAFSISFIIPDGTTGGSNHKLTAYILEGEREVMVGQIIINIAKAGAWSVSRNWDESDVDAFANYAEQRLPEYLGQDIDCADLALCVLIDYASKEGLALNLRNDMRRSYDSCSEKYSDVESYRNAVRDNLGAKDIPLNTFTII